MELQEKRDRAILLRGFLEKHATDRCSICRQQRNAKEASQSLVQTNLKRVVRQKYSIGHENYLYKCINDILFNKRMDDEDSSGTAKGSKKGHKRDLILRLKEKIHDSVFSKMNIQKQSGQFLLAAFKDYLIYDEIYDFVECYSPIREAKSEIIYYI